MPNYTLTRDSDGAAISLPHDLLWTDEHEWQPVVADHAYSLTGALVVEAATRQAGRPITLSSPSGMAWLTRAQLADLRGFAAGATATFTMELPDGRDFSVIFALHETPIEATSVKGFPDFSDGEWFSVTLRFVEI